MPFDALLQRRITGRFATGVTLLTTRSATEEWGMTANAVLSLSLDPPLMLVSIQRENHFLHVLRAGGCFAINILTLEQEAISRRFAQRGPKDFAGLPMTQAATGAPVLADALAWLDCRVANIVPGGDHDIVIGEIVAGEMRDGPHPLIFYGGQYRQLCPPNANGQHGE